MCFTKKNGVIFTALSLLISTTIATNIYAQSKTNSSFKICTVNVQAAILQTNEGKAAKLKIEKEVEQKRQSILNQQNELKKMEEEFQAQQSVLSQQDKEVKQKEFQTKLQAYQKSQINFEQETRQKELSATQQIYNNLINIVRKIRKTENCNMSFDSGAGVLLDAENQTDITKIVIDQYNTEYKGTENKKKGAK